MDKNLPNYKLMGLAPRESPASQFSVQIEVANRVMGIHVDPGVPVTLS